MKIITILELLHESKKYNDCINYLDVHCDY